MTLRNLHAWQGCVAVLIDEITSSGLMMIEQPASQSPGALVPLHSGAIAVTPCIGGVVERAGVHHRPIHEVLAGIMSVLVRVKNVRDREFPDRQDDAIAGLRPSELVDIGIDLLRFTSMDGHFLAGFREVDMLVDVVDPGNRDKC